MFFNVRRSSFEVVLVVIASVAVPLTEVAAAGSSTGYIIHYITRMRLFYVLAIVGEFEPVLM